MNKKIGVLIIVFYVITFFKGVLHSFGSIHTLRAIPKNKIKILFVQLDIAFVQEKNSSIDGLNNLIKIIFGNEGVNTGAIESY